MSQTRPNEPAGIGALVGGLAGDTQDLVRGEIALARAEFDQKLDRMMAAAGGVVGGAALAFGGMVVLLQGVAALVGLVLPIWAALLIVGVAAVGIGAAVAKSAASAISLKTLAPDRTAENLQKDAKMLKEHT